MEATRACEILGENQMLTYEHISELTKMVKFKCENWNHEYQVELRAYSVAKVEDYDYVLKQRKTRSVTIDEAKAKSEESVKKKLATYIKNFHQRCPECGFYSIEAIEQFKIAFKDKVKDQVWLKKFWLVVCGISSALVLMGLTDGRFMNGEIVLISISMLTGFFAWLIHKRILSEDKVKTNLDSINNKETCDKWLYSWRSYSPNLIELLYSEVDIKKRMQIYEFRVEPLRHDFDVIPLKFEKEQP